MYSLNRATIIGNLGQDPEIRATQSGGKVASFSVATSESWKDKQTGDRKERTEWHRIVVFNDGLCGVIERNLKKGSKVYVQGQLETRKWQDKTGADRYSTEIVLRQFGGEIVLLDRSEGGGRPPPNENAEREGKAASYGDVKGRPMERAAGADGGDLNDDIPF